jgi:hypothetical protein
VRYVLGREYLAQWLGVKMGKNCRLLIDDFGTEPWLVSLGDRVLITGGVQLITHDGSTWLFNDQKGRRYHYAPIEIGSDVFIGVNSIILPGVRIGDRVVVGAGSVVTKSVPSGWVVAGAPARWCGMFDDYRERALNSMCSDADSLGDSFREKVESVTRREFKPFMEKSTESGVGGKLRRGPHQ